MPFSISQIKKTRSDLPPRIAVAGVPKVGKNTFFSCAPGVVFLRAEDGMDHIDADAFPVAEKWADALDAVASLINEEHSFRYLAIDSLDWFEKLLHAHICAEAGVNSIEKVDKGFGKGYVRAAVLWSEFLHMLNYLRTTKRMGIGMICHTQIKKFEDPLSDAYDRWVLKAHDRVAKLTTEWADVTAFACIETFTKVEEGTGFREDRTRALTTGRRILRLNPSPVFEAGNRYGLPDTIDLAWVAFQDAMDVARGLKKLDEAK